MVADKPLRNDDPDKRLRAESQEAFGHLAREYAGWQRRVTRTLRRVWRGAKAIVKSAAAEVRVQPRPGSIRAGSMPGPPHFYSPASRRPRVAFGELTYGIYVTASPDDPAPIGVAIETGWATTWDGLPEAAWELVVRGEALVSRFLLRRGAFVALEGSRRPLSRAA
jgi:hypothetical protein